MTKPHRATPEQWNLLQRQGETLGSAESIALLELRARIEALEAAQNQPARAVNDPVWTDTPAPAGSLVERVRKAIKHEFDYDARAAIRELDALHAAGHFDKLLEAAHNLNKLYYMERIKNEKLENNCSEEN